MYAPPALKLSITHELLPRFERKASRQPSCANDHTEVQLDTMCTRTRTRAPNEEDIEDLDSHIVWSRLSTHIPRSFVIDFTFNGARLTSRTRTPTKRLDVVEFTGRAHSQSNRRTAVRCTRKTRLRSKDVVNVKSALSAPGETETGEAVGYSRPSLRMNADASTCIANAHARHLPSKTKVPHESPPARKLRSSKLSESLLSAPRHQALHPTLDYFLHPAHPHPVRRPRVKMATRTWTAPWCPRASHGQLHHLDTHRLAVFCARRRTLIKHSVPIICKQTRAHVAPKVRRMESGVPVLRYNLKARFSSSTLGAVADDQSNDRALEQEADAMVKRSTDGCDEGNEEDVDGDGERQTTNCASEGKFQVYGIENLKR
ncbi:hypothetical protein R3P38DRAFT_3343124 [Favolaschia claudopus]|uniref:Uncharacterized protein n=1 Tax=Favolaschia claudopus TaxID=2862362 RepID=A0AAW0DPA7_9AGAR